MEDKEVEKRKKVLEKYQELGNPARTILTKIINKPSGIWRGDLKKFLNRMNDKVLREGINQLLDFKIIKRKEVKRMIYYYLNKRYKGQISLIARKQSDKINLDSYRFDEIIAENTTKSKTTIYGLKPNIFRAVVKGSRNINIGKKETLEFVRGIKASELVGKTYGAPLVVKNKLRNATEEKIVNVEVSYYLDLLKKGVKKESVIRTIITAHRNHKIDFREAGENFIQKILELKKKHRKRKLEETFNQLLRKENKGRTKRMLKGFREEFILILNHCDVDQGWLEETIFKFHGIGGGLYPPSGASFDKEKWERNIRFIKAIDKLNETEKKQTIDFLIGVVQENIDLYPTHVSLLCRISSHDLMPLIEPKPPRFSKSPSKASNNPKTQSKQ